MGSARPYYRRVLPALQKETDFLRDIGLRWIIDRLEGGGVLPPKSYKSIRGVMRVFPPATAGSARGLLANMLIRNGVSPHIDLDGIHLASYDVDDPLTESAALFDKRAAAVVFASVSPHLGVLMAPKIQWAAIDPPISSASHGRFGSTTSRAPSTMGRARP